MLMSRSKYTRELLAPLVAQSRSLSEVIRKLGRTPNGGYHRLITSRIRRLELDTTHFTHRNARRAIEAVSREELESLVLQSCSVAQVLVKLGLPEEGRPHHDLKSRLRDLG